MIYILRRQIELSVAEPANSKLDPKAASVRAEVSSTFRRHAKPTIDPAAAQRQVKNGAGHSIYYRDCKVLTGTQAISRIKHFFNMDGSLCKSAAREKQIMHTWEIPLSPLLLGACCNHRKFSGPGNIRRMPANRGRPVQKAQKNGSKPCRSAGFSLFSAKTDTRFSGPARRGRAFGGASQSGLAAKESVCRY